MRTIGDHFDVSHSSVSRKRIGDVLFRTAPFIPPYVEWVICREKDAHPTSLRPIYRRNESESWEKHHSEALIKSAFDTVVVSFIYATVEKKGVMMSLAVYDRFISGRGGFEGGGIDTCNN